MDTCFKTCLYGVSQNMQKFVFTLCTIIKPVIDLELNPQQQIQNWQKFQKSYLISSFMCCIMCHIMARTDNKVYIGVLHQYPTFNWVSSTNIHRGIIYRENNTYHMVGIWFWVIILSIFCKNICNLMLCTYLTNCWLHKEISNIFTVKGFIMPR